MRKRAEQMDATRQGIIDATVHLHTTVGPAQTTVSAIAEQAGVTRLTVYRHFPDQEALFAACMERWDSLHPAPDPEPWREIADIEERARHALRLLYRWYREDGYTLLPIYRDFEAMPAAAQEATREEFGRLAEALIDGAGLRGDARHRLYAAAAHAVGLWTWHSLCVQQGLDDADAAELMTSMIGGVLRGDDPPETGSPSGS